MFGANDTQRLTRASFEPQRRRNPLPKLVAALCVMGAAGAALAFAGGRIASPLRAAEIEQHNELLLAELERAQLELRMVRSTRAELQREIDGLNAQVSELSHQIGFLNSRAPD